MTKADLRPILRLTSFVLAFIIGSVLVGLGVQFFFVLRSFGESPELRVAWVRFVLNPFVIAAVAGVIGLWVGYRRTPDSRKAIYPTVFILLLVYVGAFLLMGQ
jgi:hypothetical protein